VRPFLIWVDRHIHSPRLLMFLTMIVLLGAAYFTNAIGIHPIFGAFVTGIILPRRPAFLSSLSGFDQLNGMVFLPIFFVFSGLRTHIGLIDTPALWLLCLLVLALACFGKIAGGTLSVRWLGGSWRDALGVGVLMNTRGLVELIVLNIGLDLGVLSPPLFAMLVIMALVTTMMASPLLRLLGIHQRSQSLAGNEVAEHEQGEVLSRVD
jgi:Kef-type K+ transport system membrane component KefB